MSASEELLRKAKIRKAIDDGVLLGLRDIEELDFKPCVLITSCDLWRVSMVFLVFSPSKNGGDVPTSYTVNVPYHSVIGTVVSELVEKALELPREEA